MIREWNPGNSNLGAARPLVEPATQEDRRDRQTDTDRHRQIDADTDRHKQTDVIDMILQLTYLSLVSLIFSFAS